MDRHGRTAGETTFQQNLEDWQDVRRELTGLVARVHRDVLDDGRRSAGWP